MTRKLKADRGLEKQKLYFLDARTAPETAMGGAFDLNLLAALDVKIKQMGATRIVFGGQIGAGSPDGGNQPRTGVGKCRTQIGLTETAAVLAAFGFTGHS